MCLGCHEVSNDTPFVHQLKAYRNAPYVIPLLHQYYTPNKAHAKNTLTKFLSLNFLQLN